MIKNKSKNLKIKRQANSRRFSLKMKWSIGTGIGVLLIYGIFSILLFQSFSNLLLRQEQQYAQDALTVAQNKLASLKHEFNSANVAGLLSSDVDLVHEDHEHHKNLYSNDVFVTLSRKNIGVSVYNRQRQQVFASRSVPVKFTAKSKTQTTFLAQEGVHVFVKRSPVYSKAGHHLLGYVQVTNRLVDYDATRGKLILIF